MGISKIEKLLDQYITTETDGTVRLKGVRQPRFSDLMKLTALVRDLRAQDGNESDSPLAALSDEQLVDALVAALCALDAATLTTVLHQVHARRPSPTPQPVAPDAATVETGQAREEREPTEGEESTSVANDVQHCSPERTPARSRSSPAARAKTQGAPAAPRDVARGPSGKSASTSGRSRSSAGVGAATLSPAKVEAQSETVRNQARTR